MIKTKNPMAPVKRLMLDIEVSPNIGLFWKPGFKVSIGPDAIVRERAIICACWKWEGEKTVHSAEWDKNQDDRQLLLELLTVMEDADEVIAHFGDGFDVPWIRTRILFHGLNPMPLFKVVDTKAWASKYFLFNSNKLDYLSKFFGSTGKIKTEWQWWVDILMKDCRKTLAKMVYYCKKDVLELEFVYRKLAPHCPSHVHAGVKLGLDKWTCPRTGSKNVKVSKRRVTASGLVKWQMQNLDDGSFYSISEKAYRDYVEHKTDRKSRSPGKYKNGL